MAAGVLAYFKEEEIKDLFLDMLQEFPGSEMLFEIYSRMLVWLSNRSKKKQAEEQTITRSIQWGIRSARTIADWDKRIKLVSERPFYANIDLKAHWDNKHLFPLKIIKLVNGVKMVHLKFDE